MLHALGITAIVLFVIFIVVVGLVIWGIVHLLRRIFGGGSNQYDNTGYYGDDGSAPYYGDGYADDGYSDR